jgi:hypothetical protein
LKVLIACEQSGIVREAFKKRGHDAWSCDIMDSEIPGQHIKDDVLNHLNENWDLMIAHPPCTYLAVSGARWFKDPERQKKQALALVFVKKLMDAPIPKIAIENPVSIISSKIRQPDQIIQPWQFGHGEMKTTCLWLKNLPTLKPTNIVGGRLQRIWRCIKIDSNDKRSFKDRAKERSRTFNGIAEGMASQWTTPQGIERYM